MTLPFYLNHTILNLISFITIFGQFDYSYHVYGIYLCHKLLININHATLREK